MVSELNALQINESNGNIVLACGATGYFQVDIETDGELDPASDVAVFAIARARSSSYTTVFRKDYPIEKTAEGAYSVIVSLANEDTREIAPGNYVWTLILVTDPGRDETGQVIVNSRTDGVYPLWAGSAQPTLELRGIAYVV